MGHFKSSGGRPIYEGRENVGNTLPFFTPAAPYLLTGEGIAGFTNALTPSVQRASTSSGLQNLGISKSASDLLAYVPPAVETGLGLLGIGSIAKNVVSKTQSGQAPEITFQAQVENLPSGNQQVGVLTGSTLGKATSLSASSELVFPETILNPASEGRFIPAEQINLNPTEVYQITPSGRLIQAGKEITEVKNIPSAANENIASLGGGYSKTLIGKETILSKFEMGGTAQPLGNINLFSTDLYGNQPGLIDRSLITSSNQIEGQAYLSNSVINEIVKVSNKEGNLLPETINQKILAIFKENPDGSFNVVGSTQPLLRVNKATGEVSVVARNLNIEGKVIQFQDIRGNSVVVQISDLSKPVQQSILNQVSAAAKAYSPVSISPSAPALYEVPSYLGGGLSLLGGASAYAYNPEMVSPSLSSGATIETLQRNAPSSTFVNLNVPAQRENAGIPLTPSLNLIRRKKKPSKQNDLLYYPQINP